MMLGRRQLPVASPVSFPSLAGAVWPALALRAAPLAALAAELRGHFQARQLALTDSGTSALVLALRLACGRGGTVAFPGYACVDLAAAARYADVRVRLYDLDPETLSPDLASLEGALRRGVDAVVVAPLYGFPQDMPAVAELASRYCVTVIEDAAQGAGATLHGRPVGSFGMLTVLSFGRGKGLSGGRGGALLSRDARFDDRVAHLGREIGRPRPGWRELATVGAQWALGRPALYGIPSAIPGLRLGEMVYHPAHEPRSLTAASAALVTRALARAPRELSVRRRTAAALAMAAEEGADVRAPRPIEGAVAGYLRFPVVDSGGRSERHDLGILRGYPRTLHEQDELRPVLLPGEPETPGAVELRRGLFTLPTHSMLSRDDIERLGEWLRVPIKMLIPGARPRRGAEDTCPSM
ncbi:MAG TPA: DegT/DnrJ/EryC1/StrS family aminotransferase [Gemmatimonadaceae bacterium]|nr:DegT/DnrJ/EryC1/StrS family aminotransferase [Gemmatimonadaceae bacterium]